MSYLAENFWLILFFPDVSFVTAADTYSVYVNERSEKNKVNKKPENYSGKHRNQMF